MPSFEPYFAGPLERRRYVRIIDHVFSPTCLATIPMRTHANPIRLLNLYHKLHANLHNKPATLKVHHETNMTNIALAWSTPLFELYAVAPANTSRAALAQSANRIVQWVRKEEERVFIIGGAVF
jgi:hypothetical protein